MRITDHVDNHRTRGELLVGILGVPLASRGAGERAKHAAEHAAAIAVATARLRLVTDVTGSAPATPNDGTLLGGQLLVCLALFY